MPEHVDKVIGEVVAAAPEAVSIAASISKVRAATHTGQSDVDLEMAIGTVAAYQGKPILFDRLK